jgi:rhodanese-related sulfurtransferase
MLARLARMSVKYISRDVCQTTAFYVILDIRISFLQDLSKIIKSDKRPGKDYLVVDVRDDDFIGGHIPNCRNEPSTTFPDKLDDLVRDAKDVPQVIFHCALSQSRWVTARILYDLRDSDCCKRYPGVQRLYR